MFLVSYEKYVTLSIYVPSLPAVVRDSLELDRSEDGKACVLLGLDFPADDAEVPGPVVHP